MRKFPKLMAAVAAVAGLSSFTPAIPQSPAPAGANITTPVRAENTRTPAPASTISNTNTIRGLIGGGCDLIVRPPCIFPNNRPQPGWRKVQSRRRHNERMRRQRRNA